jgi:N6-adenosine-specific RNA methylase IME4
MAHLEFHPIADLFPLIEGAELDALRDDIKKNGLRDPLCEYDGKLLDGRNRLLACEAAGIVIPSHMIERFDSEKQGDPLAWVISKNLKRRHLNESQRSWVASKIETFKHGDNQHKQHIGGDANLRVLRKDAAELLNVSERSVASAAVVRDDGEPELQHAVEQGHLAVSLAAIAANLPAVQQREIAKRAASGEANVVRKVIKKHIRAQKEQELGAKQLALPDKKYGVILADPEWKFVVWSENGMNCAADNHYPTSTLDEIKKRDVASISADNCVLFLWATVPMLPQALEVMTAWGFKYVSGFAWVKDKAGTGYWNRNQHEHLLIGVKGNPIAPALGTQWSSVIEAPVGKHSEKPELSLALIEDYFPTLPKIELNRRGPARDGWDAWGAEAEPPRSVAVVTMEQLNETEPAR